MFEHPHLDTIAQFRLSNAGLGNRYPRFAGVMYNTITHCPLCHNCILTESHVIFFCPSVERERRELDLVFYRNLCSSQGYGDADIFSLFVNGIDWNGNPVYREEILSRGLAMDTLRGHWLSRW